MAIACLLLPMVCCAQLFFALHFAQRMAGNESASSAFLGAVTSTYFLLNRFAAGVSGGAVFPWSLFHSRYTVAFHSTS